MARNWEEFFDPGTPRIAPLHVSMSPYGTINLSRNAHEALDRPRYVVLLWEDDTNAIGMRPVPPETINAFRLYDSGRSGAHRLHALRFVTKHKIKLDRTVRFPTAHIEGGILVLELDKIVQSPRAVRPVPERKGWKVKTKDEEGVLMESNDISLIDRHDIPFD
ncbi:MAG: hypothetical protein QM785_15525 [Pyrinomonadaceae bacterium]